MRHRQGSFRSVRSIERVAPKGGCRWLYRLTATSTARSPSRQIHFQRELHHLYYSTPTFAHYDAAAYFLGRSYRHWLSLLGIIGTISMGREIPRRPLTGKARRGPKNTVNSYRRELHLSPQQVGFRDRLHRTIGIVGAVAHRSKRKIPTLLVILWIFRITGRMAQATAVVNIIGVMAARARAFSSLFRSLFRFEAELFDIPDEELENHQMHTLDRQFIELGHIWSDQDLYDDTGFRRDQLIEIYGLFGLEAYANTPPNTGKIRVWTGHRNYHFYPEELFLFMMVMCRTGHGKKLLCRKYFGGHASRWSHGFKWIVRYLDARYERTLSHEKLVDFLPQFEEFYKAINAFMQKDLVRLNHDNTSRTHEGLHHSPFKLFAFIDCTIDKVCRPRSGPAGNYIGAPRREHEQEVQESVYTGFRKYHGIKNEVLELPNGISTVYGPTSARIHDVGGVMQMSNLDNFLTELQVNEPVKYMALGDSAYCANYLNCEYYYYSLIIISILSLDRHRLESNTLSAVFQ